MKSVLKRGLICSLLLVAAGLVLFCAFISGEKKESDETVSLPKSEDSLKVILQVDRFVYSLGEPIAMHLIIGNEKTDEPLRLGFGSSQRYDFIVTQEDKEIWRWSSGKFFAMVLEETVLQPQETLRYTEIWDQRDNQGEFIQAGRYTLVGVLKTYSEITSEPVVVEIKPHLAASQLCITSYHPPFPQETN